ncbi:Ubiquitin-conjugating enzyme E2 2, partial [Blyttiomyces sp. JEL0837]
MLTANNVVVKSPESVMRREAAIKRLVRDLAELQQNPAPYANAAPVDESNMFLWHGNLTSPSVPFKTHPVHIKIEFKPEYPVKPPLVQLYIPVPHNNVFPGRGGLFDICLDMLGTGKRENQVENNINSVATTGNFPYSGWSSAYTVRSILMQLQSFLLDGSVQRAVQNGDITLAARVASTFSCPVCPHRADNAWPVVNFGGKGHVLGGKVGSENELVLERPIVTLTAAALAQKRSMARKGKRTVVVEEVDEHEDGWKVVGDVAQTADTTVVSGLVDTINAAHGGHMDVQMDVGGIVFPSMQ